MPHPMTDELHEQFNQAIDDYAAASSHGRADAAVAMQAAVIAEMNILGVEFSTEYALPHALTHAQALTVY